MGKASVSVAPTGEMGGKAGRQFFGGVSKHVVLGLFCMYAWLCGPGYLNFTPLSDMLAGSGAYEWLCTAEDTFPDAGRYEIKCGAQGVAFSTMMSFATAAHFCFSFIGGISVDFLGNKPTGLIGITVHFLGWILIGLSSQSFPAYVPGMVIMALGIDASFFAILDSASLFPGNENLVISILGSFRSLSFLIPLLLNTVYQSTGADSAGGLIITYAIVGLAYGIVIAALYIPKGKFVVADNMEVTRTADEMTHIADMKQKGTEMIEGDQGNAVALASEATEALPFGHLTLIQALIHPSFLMMVVYFAIFMLRAVFFIPTASITMPDAYKANQIINTLGWVPCPFIGRCADKYGIVPTMHICNIMGTLAIIFAMIPGVPSYVPFQYLSSLMLAGSMAFLASQIYCYMGACYKRQSQGTLIGICGAAGGCATLLVPAMTVAANTHGYMSMLGVLVGLSVLSVMLLAGMQVTRGKAVAKVASG